MGWTMTLDNDQRSIVQRILAKYLDGQALDQAVELWRYQYSKKPLQELNYFVFEIANSSELRSSRKQIVHDLQHGLELDVQQNLNHEPIPQSSPQKTLATVSSNNTQPHHDGIIKTADQIAINELFQQLLQSLKGQSELIVVLQEHLQGSQITPQYQHAFIHYVQTGEGLVEQFYLKDVLRQVINTLYTVMCDYFGPMKSDRYMAQAVAQIDQQYPAVMIKQYL
ncbi:hypothetical protein MKI79_02330 [Acinetobacter sp. A3.8]|uniref:Uncharacterized protein n=1 Tax=Acinetobacter sedimenti TaxID=2919922 RepID=A0A9X1WVE9_9GAMM|nr:hypothetical protein [Acinetobacter sedimenti]MCJ8145756.1 hypothetical protein [Acinetobacter sedimenti]